MSIIESVESNIKYYEDTINLNKLALNKNIKLLEQFKSISSAALNIAELCFSQSAGTVMSHETYIQICWNIDKIIKDETFKNKLDEVIND